MNLNKALHKIAVEHSINLYRSDYMGDIQYAFQVRDASGGLAHLTICYLKKQDEHGNWICLALEMLGDTIDLDDMQVARLTDYILEARKHFQNVHTFNPDGGAMGRGVNKYKL
jgi:hypothetical protein